MFSKSSPSFQPVTLPDDLPSQNVLRASHARCDAQCWGKCQRDLSSSTCSHLSYNQEPSLPTLSPLLPPPELMVVCTQFNTPAVVSRHPLSATFFGLLYKVEQVQTIVSPLGSRMDGNHSLGLLLSCCPSVYSQTRKQAV